MTEALIPPRSADCPARAARPAGPHGHEPGARTVDTEHNSELEWQYGTCRHCDRSISRFRILIGGGWFDRWGDTEGSDYSILGLRVD
jgi:hypothetical protein